MITKYARACMALFVSVFLVGCATTKAAPTKTQLEIREFQTRTYDTNDTKMVMKAILNVLQDDGYIIKTANTDLGLLSATKEVDISSGAEKFFSILLAGAQARYKQNSIIECSSNVSEYGNTTRVRVNFQMKSMDNQGSVLDVRQIEDEAHYKDFFSKVDKGIFIQKEKL